LPVDVLVNLITVSQMDPYDSDSSGEFPSQSTVPEPPPFNDPNYETYKHGQHDFPTLFQYALDTLSCPGMSIEYERVFGGAKKLITPERNHLREDIIEACECLKAWWRNSLVEQHFGHFKRQKQ
jgi:hypothetical protein